MTRDHLGRFAKLTAADDRRDSGKPLAMDVCHFEVLTQAALMLDVDGYSWCPTVILACLDALDKALSRGVADYPLNAQLKDCRETIARQAGELQEANKLCNEHMKTHLELVDEVNEASCRAFNSESLRDQYRTERDALAAWKEKALVHLPPHIREQIEVGA